MVEEHVLKDGGSALIGPDAGFLVEPPGTEPIICASQNRYAAAAAVVISTSPVTMPDPTCSNLKYTPLLDPTSSSADNATGAAC